jgi:hypothetical protein
MATMTIRMPDGKHERLKRSAESQGVSLNKLVDERVNGRLAASRNSSVKLSFKPLLGGGGNTIDLSASAIGAAAIDSADVVVVQDVSGSFSSELPNAKTGDTNLLSSLNITGGKSKFGLVAFTGTATTVRSLTTISGNYNTLASSINYLSIDGWGMPPPSSGTDIAAGIERAQSVFDAQGATTHSRFMIIVSDGLPSPSSSVRHWWVYSSSQLMSLANS